jgi:hypothetical protein
MFPYLKLQRFESWFFIRLQATDGTTKVHSAGPRSTSSLNQGWTNFQKVVILNKTSQEMKAQRNSSGAIVRF